MPLSTDHETDGSKLPVPVTVAEHFDVWFVWMVEGEQLTATEVIVGDGGDGGGELPPPQPEEPRRKIAPKKAAQLVRSRRLR